MTFKLEKIGFYSCIVVTEENESYVNDINVKKVVEGLQIGDPSTCRSILAYVADPSQLQACTMTGCNMDAERLYTGFVYAEGTGATPDSTAGYLASVPITPGR